GEPGGERGLGGYARRRTDAVLCGGGGGRERQRERAFVPCASGDREQRQQGDAERVELRAGDGGVPCISGNYAGAVVPDRAGPDGSGDVHRYRAREATGGAARFEFRPREFLLADG